MKKALLLSVPILAGCGHTPPPHVGCTISVVPYQHPDTAEALKAAPDIFERVKLLMAGRKSRDQEIEDQRKALEACR